MFIETLEFTIPIDLCDLFSTLKRGPRSNLEFPASVNSYGTTQDANIQVALRSNKLTFKVDGVSSNSSMISKSECKTLKLSVFDVDCSLSGAEYEQVTQMVSQPIYSSPHVAPVKRSRDRPSPMKSPPSKTSRSSFQETKHQDIPQPSPDPLQSKSESETVSVKLEPDLIEIEPDSEQFGDESNQSVDRRHNTQAALDRLSHPQSSHSQSSASSSSSFHQNVPHVPDYAEPSTSQGDQHGDQNIDDYVVYQQEDDDYGEDNDNSADFGNDVAGQHSFDFHVMRLRKVCRICGKSTGSGCSTRKCQKELWQLFNIDITQDINGVHPQRICHAHRQLFYRYNCAIADGKTYNTTTVPLEFAPFDARDTSCIVCFPGHHGNLRGNLFS
ncbi:uncharacterized protein [Haliotis asinina]|uniref:uncharacterized protein isoform X3 n=1 Tax=Haliotis asinina TaxID=109174 RepID=UPI0035319A5D